MLIFYLEDLRTHLQIPFRSFQKYLVIMLIKKNNEVG